MKIYNFPQYSPEWWEIRDLKMTASHAAEIGNMGAGLITYIDEIAATHFSGQSDNFSNKFTEYGLITEPIAGMIYSFETGQTTETVGFVVQDEYVGCSPDLLVGDSGLCEIKCLGEKNHFQILKTGQFPKKYVWQAQYQMMICQREWCDLVCYNPNFQKYLIIHRQYPDENMVKKLKQGEEKGKELLKNLIEKGEREKW